MVQVEEWTVEQEPEIDAAIAKARLQPDLPGAISAGYHPGLDAIEIVLEGGRRLLLPRKELQGLEDATEDQLSSIEIYAGRALSWPALDVDHYLPYLLAGSYGSIRWMKALERLGIPDSLNNTGHAVDGLRASYAMHPLTGPLSHVVRASLLQVEALFADGRCSEFLLRTSAGTLSVALDAAADSIETAFFADGPQNADLVVIDGQASWKEFLGKKISCGWLAMDQDGFLNTLLLAFDQDDPQLSISVVDAHLQMRLLVSASVPATPQHLLSTTH